MKRCGAGFGGASDSRTLVRRVRRCAAGGLGRSGAAGRDLNPGHHALEPLSVYQRFRAAGKLTVHVYARTPMELAGIPQWKRQLDSIERHGHGDDWLRFGGLKAFMDGSLGSMTALFFEPFNGSSTAGLMASDNSPEGKLKQNILEADKAGLQCSVHAIGDRANHLALDYFEAAERANGPRDRRFRIEHAQHLLAADIPRFAKLDVIASMQPYHAIDDGRWAETSIGHERAL
ncbi:MAG: amidohydrolase family protein, partial [Acidobacteriota bacterium]|nr:amidohydrolase family protein [Acidobacteriota bacterium]